MGNEAQIVRRRMMPQERVIGIDPSKPLGQEPETGHNRWHEAIEPVIEVPGFGFLRDEFPDPFIVHWRLHGNEYAESEQLPGVRVRCNPHPGILGLAPSAELRQRATEREADLAEREGFVLPPDPTDAV